MKHGILVLIFLLFTTSQAQISEDQDNCTEEVSLANNFWEHNQNFIRLIDHIALSGTSESVSLPEEIVPQADFDGWDNTTFKRKDPDISSLKDFMNNANFDYANLIRHLHARHQERMRSSIVKAFNGEICIDYIFIASSREELCEGTLWKKIPMAEHQLWWLPTANLFATTGVYQQLQNNPSSGNISIIVLPYCI